MSFFDQVLSTADPFAPCIPTPPLSALDGCDRCGAPARVRLQVNVLASWTDHTGAIRPTGQLDFCRHHYREHELGLMTIGASVIQVIIQEGN